MHRVKSALKRALASRGYARVSDDPEPFMRLLSRFGIDLVLDVGANVGQFGAGLRADGYTGRIVSFEPVAATYAVLAATAARHAGWETQNVGLGDYDGTAQINVSHNTVFSSIAEIGTVLTDTYHDSGVQSQEEITVRRLDSVFEEIRGRSRAVLLKCDTQGFEKRVLLGAEQSMPHLSGLHLELSYEPLYSGEETFETMVAYVRERGFDLVLLEPLLHSETDRVLQSDGTFFRRSFAFRS